VARTAPQTDQVWADDGRLPRVRDFDFAKLWQPERIAAERLSGWWQRAIRKDRASGVRRPEMEIAGKERIR